MEAYLVLLLFIADDRKYCSDEVVIDDRCGDKSLVRGFRTPN